MSTVLILKRGDDDRPVERRDCDHIHAWQTLMVQVFASRMSAQIEGDFVVFLIGMRINKWWKIRKWGSVALAMIRMQRELKKLPTAQTGCLATRLSTPGLTVQYWRSFDHLEAYANASGGLHVPAWAQFNKAAKNAREDVGIWHETFLVQAGAYETLYSGMPRQGLGQAGQIVPATGRMTTARSRMQQISASNADTTR